MLLPRSCSVNANAFTGHLSISCAWGDEPVDGPGPKFTIPMRKAQAKVNKYNASVDDLVDAFQEFGRIGAMLGELKEKMKNWTDAGEDLDMLEGLNKPQVVAALAVGGANAAIMVIRRNGVKRGGGARGLFKSATLWNGRMLY